MRVQAIGEETSDSLQIYTPQLLIAHRGLGHGEISGIHYDGGGSKFPGNRSAASTRVGAMISEARTYRDRIEYLPGIAIC